MWLQHKVGAFGGGNDLEGGNHTLEEACVRASQLPNCVGFTYQVSSHKRPAPLLAILLLF